MADVNILAPFILSWEGGFVNHPNDPGGATNRGVTIATWNAQGYDKNGDGSIDVKDLKLISDGDAAAILKKAYWDRWRADEILSQSVANLVVDWVWASGRHGIVKVQELLGVKADGIAGPKTLEAINGRDSQTLFNDIFERRKRFVESCRNFAVFGAGWLARLNSIGYGFLLLNAYKKANGRLIREKTTFNP